MEYLFVLSLIARHPLYLFSPQCYQPPSIEELVAERVSYINEVDRLETSFGEYSACIGKSLDGEYIDVIHCDHDSLTLEGHYKQLEHIVTAGDHAEVMSIRLGEKIERLMRKKLRI
jgi:hypothetical protein